MGRSTEFLAGSGGQAVVGSNVLDEFGAAIRAHPRPAAANGARVVGRAALLGAKPVGHAEQQLVAQRGPVARGTRPRTP